MKLSTEQLRRKIEAEADVTILIRQDDTPVRGNALASGDDAEDARCEDEIIARLDAGDDWAWALVTVKATWHGLSAVDHLGGCSYRDESDFRTPGGYFDDMRDEVLEDLVRQAEVIDTELNS